VYRMCLTHPSRNSVFNFKSRTKSVGFPGIITLPVAPRPARRSAELMPSCSARAGSGAVDLGCVWHVNEHKHLGLFGSCSGQII
jgi:hypothetical protein